jgi:DNA-directed RNA polymerase specialized sigma24 family protein
VEHGEFTEFVEAVEPRLRRALVAAYGSDRGREATAEALAFAWERWTEVRVMQNPTAYLYRVGQSRTRSRRRPVLFQRSEPGEPIVEPRLAELVRSLSERQRTAVILVHGYGWTLREVAELTGTKVTTVQTHVERGLRRLQDGLGGVSDASA